MRLLRLLLRQRDWSVGKATAAVLALAVVAAACTSDDSASEGTTALPTPAPTSAAPPTTVATALLADPGELGDFVPPTETLSSFDFRLSMLNTGDEPFGIVKSSTSLRDAGR